MAALWLGKRQKMQYSVENQFNQIGRFLPDLNITCGERALRRICKTNDFISDVLIQFLIGTILALKSLHF